METNCCLLTPDAVAERAAEQKLEPVQVALRRAAAKFDALVVPFGGVGSADNARHSASDGSVSQFAFKGIVNQGQ